MYPNKKAEFSAPITKALFPQNDPSFSRTIYKTQLQLQVIDLMFPASTRCFSNVFTYITVKRECTLVSCIMRDELIKPNKDFPKITIWR